MGANMDSTNAFLTSELTRIEQALARVEAALLQEIAQAIDQQPEDPTSLVGRIDIELRLIQRSIDRCKSILK